MKVALCTGFSGQDCQYLVQLLLEKGYYVIATTRRVSTEPPTRARLTGIIGHPNLLIVQADLTDYQSLADVIKTHQPDEIYNLAAQSHVAVSFKQPSLTTQINYVGFVNLVQALENHHNGDWRLYQASTSEMFGDKAGIPILRENTPLNPNSPYAIAKTASHFYARSKRAQGRFISCGILFNHESPIRGNDFVTKKITNGVRHWQKTAEVLELGNMNSVRDWGHAADYVHAMWLMLQQDVPNEFIVATGECHTVREFVEAAFKAINQEIIWQGIGVDEVGLVNGRVAVKVNPEFYRPNEVPYLKGDATKAKEVLGWTPTIKFDELVAEMVG
jgi:GDPmannose 4,6-dehydratase